MTKCNYGIGWANNGDGTCSQGSPFGDAGISADTLSRSPDVGTDAGSDTGSIVDAPADILRVVPTDGFSYPCCGAGRVESCYCAAGTACNYAPFQVCPGGGCYNIVGATEPDGGNMCGVDGGSD